jgi:hypothetical protein
MGVAELGGVTESDERRATSSFIRRQWEKQIPPSSLGWRVEMTKQF